MWALSAQMNLQVTLSREQVGTESSKLGQNTQNWLQASEKKIRIVNNDSQINESKLLFEFNSLLPARLPNTKPFD